MIYADKFNRRMKKLQQYRNIVLASSSPRRKQLLEQIGVDFIVDPSTIDEVIPEGVSPSQLVQILALQKARDVAAGYSEGLIVGADTIVVVDGAVLGKPKDNQDAFAMLSSLQGKEHQVYTGIALINSSNNVFDTGYECTKVYFNSMTEDEINGYIASGETAGKAGAYGIQGLGSIFINRIEGCYFNVVGLPLSRLYIMLQRQGIDLLGGTSTG